MQLHADLIHFWIYRVIAIIPSLVKCLNCHDQVTICHFLLTIACVAGARKGKGEGKSGVRDAWGKGKGSACS